MIWLKSVCVLVSNATLQDQVQINYFDETNGDE